MGGEQGASKKAKRSSSSTPSSSSSSSSGEPVDGVTLQEFTDFFSAKAFDVISDNRYRKHLSQGREAGEPWGVRICASITAVQSKVRRMHSLVSSIPESTHRGLLGVCKEIAGNTLPPVKVKDGFHTCTISGMRSEGCIEICKIHPARQGGGGSRVASGPQAILSGSGQPPASNSVVIHPRFAHFALMLWYVVKIEHVIRNFTRCWLDHLQDNEPASVSSLCDRFASQERLIESMHAVFVHAYKHVRDSITASTARPGASQPLP